MIGIREMSKFYEGEHTTEDYLKYYQLGYIDEVVAAIYVKYQARFTLPFSTWNIEKEERTSIILTEIWKALEKFDVEKAKGATLETVIYNYIERYILSWNKSQNYDVRKINNDATVLSALDETNDEGEEGNMLDKLEGMQSIDEDREKVELAIFVKSLNLTDNEEKYCLAAINGISKKLNKSSIATAIGISRAGANNIVKKLQVKLVDLIA